MGTFQTYQATGNRENLLDIITNISPTDTPMFSTFRKVHVNGTYVEWQTDTLATAASNAQIEGADYTAGTITATSRTGTYTQILGKYYKISRTQEQVSKAGRSSEVSYHKAKALKELARDAEYMLVNATGASGASGTARETTGVLAWISTTMESGSGSGEQALDEDMLNDCLEDVWAQGGMPNSVYADGFQKRKIAAFTGLATITRNDDARAKRLVSVIDVYQSIFGILDIVLDRYMTETIVAVVQDSMFEIGVLSPIKTEKIAKTGDSERFQVIAELACLSLNEAASGQITGLTTA